VIARSLRLHATACRRAVACRRACT